VAPRAAARALLRNTDIVSLPLNGIGHGKYTERVAYTLEASAPDALPEIVSFLRHAFHAPADAPNLSLPLLTWKYCGNGPEWNGSRSYVLRKGSAIAAHIGAWPIRLATPSGFVQALQAVDWASARESPGAGAALMNKLREMVPVLIVVGGSRDTQRVLPAMGFRQHGAAGIYARVLRPWRQFRTRRFEGPRALPRLVRNTVWSRSPVASAGGWTDRSSDRPDPRLLSRFGAQTRLYPESRCRSAFLEFMLRCPAAAFLYFELFREGDPQGYFVLSRVGGQTRLADLRIFSDKPADWAAAYAVAVRAAARDPQSCELLASAFVPAECLALEANGFRARGDKPVFVLDPKYVLGGPAHLHLSMLDDDSAYLNFPENPYST
jgi:hypothetical protein